MPLRARVEEFVQMVVDERHVEAIEHFYHHDASMQENLDAPRRGRDNLVAHEIASHQKIISTHTTRPKLIVIDGDDVVIHWTFDVTTFEKERRRLEEVAVQKWHGDRIIREQFIYDTAKAWHLVD